MGTSQSTPTGETPNGPNQGYDRDLFYNPPLSTQTDQTSNRPDQHYMQDPFNYPPPSIPTNPTPNEPNQTSNQPVQGYLQNPYPPMSMPTHQTPIELVDYFNQPHVRTSGRNRRCYSCNRLEPIEVEYTSLGDDGRYLCLDCLPISLMESKQLKLFIPQVYSFFNDHLKFHIKKDISIFLVRLNEMKKVLTHQKAHVIGKLLGLTLSAKQTVKIVKSFVRRGADIEAVTKKKTVRGDKVPVIFLLFGLPKPILGSTLAHEMTHTLIRLQGWRFRLEREVEESICEAVAYLWLKCTSGDYDPSYTQKDVEFAKQLTTYHKGVIKSCFSGSKVEFQKAKHAIKKYGLERTLKHIGSTRKIPV